MTSAVLRTRQALRAAGVATRPELAAATGLSVVSVDKALAELCREGIAIKAGMAESGGGRPAQRYRYRTECAQVGFFQVREEGRLLHGRLEFMDLGGKNLQCHEGAFACLEPQALDSWLDTAAAKRPLASIALAEHPAISPPLVAHLQKCYTCGVRLVRLSEALADERDESATLVLVPGCAPGCTLRRCGRLIPSGNLGQLPLPARWETLDYGDHTLVEEMTARLLLILTCTLAPRRFTLHAPFWTPKLINRIRFNATAKLGGKSPTLHFRLFSPENTAATLRQFVLKPLFTSPTSHT